MQFPHRFLGLAWICLLTISVCGCTQFQRVGARFSPATARQERETRLSFAKAYEREGELSKAEETLQLMLKSDPNDIDAKHRLGVILVRRAKINEGLELLEEAAASRPRDVAIRNDLGFAYMTCGRLEEAESEFRAALDISPKHTQSINNLALALSYQGRMQEAYSLFRQTMTEAEALANLGYAHAQRGEVDLALERYGQALSRDPSLRSAADGMIQVSMVRNQAIAIRTKKEQGMQYAQQSENAARNTEIRQVSGWSETSELD